MYTRALLLLLIIHEISSENATKNDLESPFDQSNTSYPNLQPVDNTTDDLPFINFCKKVFRFINPFKIRNKKDQESLPKIPTTPETAIQNQSTHMTHSVGYFRKVKPTTPSESQGEEKRSGSFCSFHFTPLEEAARIRFFVLFNVPNNHLESSGEEFNASLLDGTGDVASPRSALEYKVEDPGDVARKTNRSREENPWLWSIRNLFDKK